MFRTIFTSVCSLLLATALLAALAVPASAAPPAAVANKQATYRADIRRTPYGVPHVKADDFAGLGFGMGLASTEDTICELFDRILTASGNRAIYLGRGNNDSNVTSDLFYARHRVRVQEWLDGSPASVDTPSQEARDLVRGFAAGVSKYVRDVGRDNIPDARCRGNAWVREIDELDYWIFLSTYLGVAQMGGQVAAIPPGGTQECPNDFALEAVDDAQPPAEQTVGSNAYGLGGDATKNGRGALLGNPHYPWTGSNRFYRSHAIIPGVLNVVGAGLINTPLVGIGHNEHMAWSHTVSTAVRSGFFELTLAPGDPTSYLYEGEPRAMRSVCVSAPILEADGSITAASRVFYDTHFGPMVETGTFPWTDTRAFAFRDATAGLRFVDQYIAMAKARSVRELAAALNQYGGTAFNTTAADSSGEAFYGDIGAIPNVSEAKAAMCVLPGTATSQWNNRNPVLDGSRAECDWANDPGAPPGLSGLASAPHLFRSDYVTNSNDSYWLTNPEEPLEGYSRVYGNERSTRSLRTRMGLKMVAERIAGSDGLGAPGFDLETVQDVMFSNRQLGAEQARDDLVTRCRIQTSVVVSGVLVNLTPACDVIEAWDLRDNLESRGAHVWRQFVTNGGLVWTVPFDVNDPVNTPRQLSMTSNTVMTALGNAVRTMQLNGIPLDARLGDVQSVTRQGERIPLHGGSGTAGQFNVITTGGLGPNGWTSVSTGASWIMSVHFTDDGPRSEGVLTYSQSTNPESPHAADQTKLYSQYGWEDLYYTDAAVDAAAVRREIALEGKDDCKSGGWQRFVKPSFVSQGECVSYFTTERGGVRKNK
jgi:acyl-homoserine-lactone acylase